MQGYTCVGLKFMLILRNKSKYVQRWYPRREINS